jgi:hypothetical protein
MSVSDPFVAPPRIEPETSRWLAHWKRKKTTEKILLVCMFLLAAWLTVRWYGLVGKPVSLMQMALTWFATLTGFFSRPKEEKPEIALELNHPLSYPAKHSTSKLR